MKGFQVTKVVLLLAGWLVLFHAASASDRYAEPEFRITPKIFTSDDGLPQSGVSTMLQSRDGYLWIGTFGGLARFDGQTFTMFREAHSIRSGGHGHVLKSRPSSDRILALYEDAAARLWIGTEDAGLNVYADGAFRHLPVCGGTCQINDVLQSPDRSIWAASNAGVLKLDPETGREVWIKHAAEEGFTRLVSDDRGQVYVGGYGGFYALEDDTLRRIELPAHESRVWVLQRTGKALLVGTEYGLYEYSPREQRWRSLGVSHPTYATQDAEGLWWVLQANGTVVREDGRGRWKNVPELTGIGVISLARDDEGNLWVGTGSKGLWRIRKPLFGVLGPPQLGTNWAGRAVISDGKGGLWFGSACGGLRHWTRNGRMQAVRIEEALGTECVTSLLLDRSGALWIGSALGSLARIAGDTPEHVLTWDAKEPVNLWQLKDGGHIAATGTSTYLLTQDANGRVSISRSIRALQGMRLNNVVSAVRGGYWFVGDQGVLRLMGEQVVERWTPKEGLSSRFARALYEDDESGDIWVGTYGGGLNRITKGEVYRYDSRNGLFDDAVSCILKDARGRLWLGGNRGVTVLKPAARAGSRIESVGYGAHDGLVPAEINGGTSSPCHLDSKGRMWFSLVEGFGMTDPSRFPEREPTKSRPRIEHALAAGRPVDIATGTITLPPYTRTLDIRYTAINLARPQETRFRFRLSGVDRDWVEAGKSRNVLYPTVPWGRHLFEVQSTTVGGVWSPISADLLIVHPQPWYLRPWVWTLATLLGLLVLVFSSRLERARSLTEAGTSI